VTVAPGVPGSTLNRVLQGLRGRSPRSSSCFRAALSNGVMTRLCEEKTGLFPVTGKDIVFTCSCPDWAVDVQARGRVL